MLGQIRTLVKYPWDVNARLFRLKVSGKSPMATVDSVVPLTHIAAGNVVSIDSVRGGRRLSARLISMGLPMGIDLEVLQNRGGAMVVGRHSTRIALGPAMAAKILVRRISTP